MNNSVSKQVLFDWVGDFVSESVWHRMERPYFARVTNNSLFIMI